MSNEYLVNSADLSAVADAIRTKGGTSDALAFPSEFVSAIAAIQAGSGGEIKSASGAYTIAEDTTALSIDISDLGWEPDMAFIELDETDFEYTSTPTKAWAITSFPAAADRQSYYTNVYGAVFLTNLACLWRGGKGTNTYQIASNSANVIGRARGEDPLKINTARSAASYPIIAGTYKWSVFKVWG